MRRLIKNRIPPCIRLRSTNHAITNSGRYFQQYHNLLSSSYACQVCLLSSLRCSLSSKQCRYKSSSSIASIKESADDDNNKKQSVTKEPSIEEQYSRKTPLEHILLRPGMYIGPVERSSPSHTWVLEPTPEPPNSSISFSNLPDLNTHHLNPTLIQNPLYSVPSESKQVVHSLQKQFMIQKNIASHLALIKIFDEILVNAFDNRLRHHHTKSSTKQQTTHIHVIIHPGSKKHNQQPFISVQNNGKGIPIEIHKKEQIYVPEMLFGHLLTGSNFDDTKEKRIVGGRHGYGAKLTNIFSKFFLVDIVDSKRNLKYSQSWEDNMKIMNEATIQKLKMGTSSSHYSQDYTRVSFVPDIGRLVEQKSGDSEDDFVIPKDDYAIMCRRVYDVAGCSGGDLTVTLNGHTLPIHSFEDYVKLHLNSDTKIGTVNDKDNNPSWSSRIGFHRINARWEIAVCASDTGSFEGTSFVNGMATTRGGTHLNVIVQQITKHIHEKIIKDHPEFEAIITQALVRRHLKVFVNSFIENPMFDSQTKEFLTSNPTTFGSNYNLPNTFLNSLLQSRENGGLGIVEHIVHSAQGRLQATLLKEVGGSKKTKRQILSIPKLDDAHLAGSDQSQDCTLILTEGDSAKALAIAGLEIVGRKTYGVFPLRGKFLNVRDAPAMQLLNNQEVKALCSIVGLDFDKDYSTVADRTKLRYGNIMLMTDQDADGSHIKGLIINFFRHFWPKLLKPAEDCPDGKPFLSSFITPLLKASKKGGKKNEVKNFYSMIEYNKWRSSLPDHEINKWNVKYYKGLGTSTAAEAKEYFRDFERHYRPFRWNSDEDGTLVDMVFEKDRASDRRAWLNSYDDTITLDMSDRDDVTYEEFINKEMIHFSNADNIRSLPSAIDGLKPSQRKVLYACFKRNLKNEIKVAQLTGYCAEHTAYHHGEASLHATITGMAQDFVGSNNINLLVPSGQFGTRMAGGKDAASPRYIFTSLSPLARILFPESDSSLLTYLEDDGVQIEPKYFCPIIPLLLINGSQGIGTGWSTMIPPHDPRDAVAYIRAKLNDKGKLPSIQPWVNGFVGNIEAKSDKSGYISTGIITKKSRNTVVISELPVGTWTNNYKDFLLKMQNKSEIDSFVENHTTTSVSFTVNMKAAQLNRLEKSGLEKSFKLESSLPTSNMHAFDQNNVIKKFETIDDIMNVYFPVRLGLYHDRKNVLLREKTFSAATMRNKARFIEDVISGNIDLLNGKRSKLDTVNQLHDLEFTKATDLQNILNNTSMKGINDEEVYTHQDGKDESKEYDYLLNLPLSSLTSERIVALQTDYEKTETELEEIKECTPEDLWRSDLKKLEPHLKKYKSKRVDDSL